MNVPEAPDPVHLFHQRKARLRMVARVTITAAVVTIVCEAITGFVETWPVWIALALVVVGMGAVVVSVALSWRATYECAAPETVSAPSLPSDSAQTTCRG